MEKTNLRLLYARASKFLFLLLALITVSACSYLRIPPDSETPRPPVNVRNTITETADYISIQSNRPGIRPTVGLVFYQGGLVDAKAYQEWLNTLVYLAPTIQVVLVKMPNNLAVLDPTKGLRLKAAFPNLQQWVIAGHSLGGAMAAKVVDENRDAFRALILLGAYPPEANNLSDWDQKVLDIYGSEDAISTPEEIKSFAYLLPPAYNCIDFNDFAPFAGGRTYYYEIQGGNHSQFGDYGQQAGDNPARISAETQQKLVIYLIKNFIGQLK